MSVMVVNPFIEFANRAPLQAQPSQITSLNYTVGQNAIPFSGTYSTYFTGEAGTSQVNSSYNSKLYLNNNFTIEFFVKTTYENSNINTKGAVSAGMKSKYPLILSQNASYDNPNNYYIMIGNSNYGGDAPTYGKDFYNTNVFNPDSYGGSSATPGYWDPASDHWGTIGTTGISIWNNGNGPYTGNVPILIGPTSIADYGWHHVAIVRTLNDTLYLYVDGYYEGQTGDGVTGVWDFSNFTIGGNANDTIDSSNTTFSGFISNLRVCNAAIYSGTSINTPNFTVPTSSLTVIPGITQLLTCQNSTFIDNSPNNITLTSNGAAIPTNSGAGVATYTAVNGGVKPYTYSVSSGTLPTGLSLSSTTGYITGTPTASQSASPVTVVVTDSTSAQASLTSTINFTVNPVPVATAKTGIPTQNIPSVPSNWIAAVNGNRGVFFGGTFYDVYANNTGGAGFKTGPYYISPFTGNPTIAGSQIPAAALFAQSGKLPTGLQIMPPTSNVTGMPNISSPDAATITFAQRDGNGVTATNTDTVTFTPNTQLEFISAFSNFKNPAPTFTTTPFNNGEAYRNFQLVKAIPDPISGGTYLIGNHFPSASTSSSATFYPGYCIAFIYYMDKYGNLLLSCKGPYSCVVTDGVLSPDSTTLYLSYMRSDLYTSDATIVRSGASAYYYGPFYTLGVSSLAVNLSNRSLSVNWSYGYHLNTGGLTGYSTSAFNTIFANYADITPRQGAAGGFNVPVYSQSVLQNGFQINVDSVNQWLNVLWHTGGSKVISRIQTDGTYGNSWTWSATFNSGIGFYGPTAASIDTSKYSPAGGGGSLDTTYLASYYSSPAASSIFSLVWNGNARPVVNARASIYTGSVSGTTLYRSVAVDPATGRVACFGYYQENISSPSFTGLYLQTYSTSGTGGNILTGDNGGKGLAFNTASNARGGAVNYNYNYAITIDKNSNIFIGGYDAVQYGPIIAKIPFSSISTTSGGLAGVVSQYNIFNYPGNTATSTTWNITNSLSLPAFQKLTYDSTTDKIHGIGTSIYPKGSSLANVASYWYKTSSNLALISTAYSSNVGGVPNLGPVYDTLPNSNSLNIYYNSPPLYYPYTNGIIPYTTDRALVAANISFSNTSFSVRHNYTSYDAVGATGLSGLYAWTTWDLTNSTQPNGDPTPYNTYEQAGTLI